MGPCDVAVVGGGVIGAAVARALAVAGARVVLLERCERVGQGASGAAAGMLAPCSEADEAGAFLDLARASLALWAGLATELVEAGAGDCELSLDGLLRVALDDEDAAALRSRLEWQKGLGVEVDWLDAAQLAELEPAAARPMVGAAWYPAEGHVHSPRAVTALIADAERRGVEVRGGAEVVGAGDGALRLGDGSRIATATVVVAAGAWSGRLGAAFGLGDRATAVAPVRGQLLALRGLDPLPRHVIFGGRRGYAVAKRDGLLLVGATEEDAGFDMSISEGAGERLLTTASRLVAGAASATVAHSWAGLRPRTPDGLPLLGDAGEAGGMRVVLATGHHRNGVLLAPATAAGIASIVLERRPPPGWAAFDPARR